MTAAEWLERAQCPVCGAHSRRHVLDKEGGSYVACQDCGLIYTSPAQSRASQAALAEEWAVKHHASPDKVVWEGDPHVQRLIYHSRIESLEPYRSSGRLLDVGCSTGDFLSYAKFCGWEIYGSELAGHTAELARQRLDCEVRQGFFEDAGFDSGFFDVVTMWDVVEHVLDPGSLVATALDVLRPGGVLVLFTPNYDSLSRRLIFDRWSALIPDRHLCVFNKQTIERLLTDRGGDVTQIRSMDINPHEIFNGERRETDAGLKGRQRAMGRIKQLLIRYPWLQWLRGMINVLLNATNTGDVLEVIVLKR